jgi:putative OPT family oligopeptide transporter
MSTETLPESKVEAEPEFRPFVPPEAVMREYTLRGIVIGCILGIVFAASSVYLGLKVGLTVSASIPVAVLSITLFKWMTRAFRLQPATILENNIVQTTGSAGESIAAGISFTLPSLLLMGFDLELARILLVALLGGLIGVLMMIPLRHGLIVKEHGKLTYPEGTACADVLIVGEKGGTSAVTVFLGFFVGLFYAVANLILTLWKDTATFALDFWGKLRGATLAFEVSPAMLGVGYIIGPKTAANMMAGGSLAFLVLVPLVHLFGDSMAEVMYPANKLIKDMSPHEIRNNFILYIGAGAVATGGFISLARALPTILSAFAGGLKSLGAGKGQATVRKRTENDLPMSVVLLGSLGIALAIWLAPILEINAISAVLIILFGFFFVTVSSRVTGEIGSSSNPISGMTVATLLITCGLFVLIGWTGIGYKAMALTTAALVCVAASNGGTISQDLKTGFLVGATPRHQQVSILIGVVTSAIVIGFVLLMLNRNNTTFRPLDIDANLSEHVAADEHMNHPDGTSYRVAYMREDEGAVPRGKYLVDEAGKPLYFVDPGVCGTFEWNFQLHQGDEKITVDPNVPIELGADRKPYRRVHWDGGGGLEQGDYLAREDGTVAYLMRRASKFDAPKAQLFRLIIDGTLGGQLPWGLVLVGVFLAILMELVGVSALPFAVGLYLPISTSAAIFVGGIVRWLVEKRTGSKGVESEFSPGVLMASGLIAGAAIAGVVQSVIAFGDVQRQLAGKEALLEIGTPFQLREHNWVPGIENWWSKFRPEFWDTWNDSWWPMIPFLLMALVLYFVGARRKRPT